jgi:hypothetical protein
MLLVDPAPHQAELPGNDGDVLVKHPAVAKQKKRGRGKGKKSLARLERDRLKV